MHRNNVRRRRKLEGNLGETVRIASIVQKGVDTGRSSYVEMRALARTTNRNLRPKVRAILEYLDDDIIKILPAELSEGYTDVLTPNGNVRQDRLDRLLSIDADIVTYLGIIESELKNNSAPSDSLKALRELVQERKKFVDALRA
ncbi:hypothetical protein [Nitrososphaera sp.]|uniref:hypothetical protein n=1 Tax=Nitrososphaera sp. TaxID=1971748 RepID=UPI0017A5AB67|nr:hypothetical protein [Nitrososphaera sp.]NWG37855.1 hypothetical protein [Nitrososphaera sp.]